MIHLIKRRNLCCLLFVIFAYQGAAQFSFTTGTANTSKNGQKQVRLLNEVATVANLSQYGGSLNSKTTATGYFQIKYLKTEQ